MIKRQMYGRASFPLLRKRVLPAPQGGPVAITK
jgi:transposase